MKKILLFILIIIPFIVLANVQGDVNGNDKVDSADYILVRKHILKQTTLTGEKLERADANNDGKVNSMDYVVIRKLILEGNTATPTPSPTATPTVTATPAPKYEVKYYGASIVETGLSSATLSGSTAVPIVQSNTISLSVDTQYVVSFDYKTSSGTNQFDVDLYPDSLPQVNPKATTELKHYDWELSSSDSNMGSCQLRFFDDIQEASESDITISNIVMGTVSKVSKTHGEKLGNLPTPTRSGYKFLGWFTSSTGGTQVKASTIVTSNMVLYPHWETTETFTEGPGGELYSRTVTYMGKTFKDYKQNRMGAAIEKGGCGPVSLYSILSAYDDSITIDDIIKITGLSTSFNYINKAANKFGLQTSKIYVYSSRNPNEAAVKNYTKIAIDALKEGKQIIVLVARSSICPNGNCNGWPYDAYSWGNHFIAIVGVKQDGEHVIILNPMESRMEEGRMEDIIRYYPPGGPQSGFVIYSK